MSLESQTIYGWPVAIDLTLGGTGAGAFLMAIVLNALRGQQSFADIVFLAGPVLVLMGAVILLADIAVRRRFYRIFSNVKSWTARGAWILTFFIIFALIYYMISSPPLGQSAWANSTLFSEAIAVLTVLFGIFVMIYPGFLMGTIQAIPFWNTPLLPLLFLLSGLANGSAFLMLIIPFFHTHSSIGPATLQGLGGTTAGLLLFQAASLYAFMERAGRGNVACQESLSLFRVHLKGKIILGIIIPVCLILLTILMHNPLLLPLFLMAAALLTLTGGLLLRHAIIRAGVFLPRFVI